MNKVGVFSKFKINSTKELLKKQNNMSIETINKIMLNSNLDDVDNKNLEYVIGLLKEVNKKL